MKTFTFFNPLWREFKNLTRPHLDPQTVTLITAMRSADKELIALRSFIVGIGFDPYQIAKDIDDPKTAFMPKDQALWSLVVTRDFSRSALFDLGKKQASEWLDSISLKHNLKGK